MFLIETKNASINNILPSISNNFHRVFDISLVSALYCGYIGTNQANMQRYVYKG